MKISYFELENDRDINDRWYLNELVDNAGIRLDAREFRYGVPADVGPPLKSLLWNEDKVVETEAPLRIRLDPKRRGVPLDFTYTNDVMPVVTSKIGTILDAIAGDDIQRIPSVVESRPEQYEIINVITLIDCIDKARSNIQWYKEGNDIRPDLAGQPEMVMKLVIDSDRVGGHHMFRIEGWSIALIVSHVIKDAFEKAHVSGIKFREVSS